ncbi:MAG TPA: efflux RND transporter periplasmic adaptor subunit [Bacteroidales bacterium]|nr:efflux RND transporter periplasmic adaptor subunit [Bacteroidales bacterium]
MTRKKSFNFSSLCNCTMLKFTGILLLIFVLTMNVSCKKESKPQAGGPAEVSVIMVEPRDTSVIFEYVAQTQSSQMVNIYSRVSGFLDKRVYTEGTMVKEGQVLFLMDKKPFQVQVDGYMAALARQKAAFETARMNLERTKPLAEKKALSQKDLDDATGRYESAAAAVEEAKAQLENAKLNLSYCTITSPITGITSAAMQQDGTYINAPNSQLTTVAVLSPMWVNFSLSENDMAKLRDEVEKKILIPPREKNHEVEIVLVDGSIFPQKGRITFMEPSYNPQTGTFLLRSSFTNPNGILRPNQYVRARVKGFIRPNAILVPQRAVQQGAKGHFIWVVNKEGKAESRPVVVGDWMGNDWFISQGLHAGDQVVVDGGLALRPGEPVKIKAQAPAGESIPAAAPKVDTGKAEPAKGGK